MVEFVRDVIIAVALLATAIALAVRSGSEQEATQPASATDYPATAYTAQVKADYQASP